MLSMHNWYIIYTFTFFDLEVDSKRFLNKIRTKLTVHIFLIYISIVPDASVKIRLPDFEWKMIWVFLPNFSTQKVYLNWVYHCTKYSRAKISWESWQSSFNFLEHGSGFSFYSKPRRRSAAIFWKTINYFPESMSWVYIKMNRLENPSRVIL